LGSFDSGFWDLPYFLLCLSTEGDQEGDQVMAIYGYQAQHEDELSFAPDDVITVTDRCEGSDWWRGQLCGGRVGMFPSNYVVAVTMDHEPIGTQLVASSPAFHRKYLLLLCQPVVERVKLQGSRPALLRQRPKPVIFKANAKSIKAIAFKAKYLRTRLIIVAQFLEVPLGLVCICYLASIWDLATIRSFTEYTTFNLFNL